MLLILVSLILAALGGLFFGLVFPVGMRLLGIPTTDMVGLEAGLLFVGMVFPVIMLILRWQQRRIRKAVEKLPSPPTHSFSLPVIQGGRSRPMAVFLCEDCLCLVDTNKRGLPMTLYPAADIVRTLRIHPRQMELHLTEGRGLTFCTGGTEALHAALQARGWLPFQH